MVSLFIKNHVQYFHHLCVRYTKPVIEKKEGRSKVSNLQQLEDLETEE